MGYLGTSSMQLKYYYVQLFVWSLDINECISSPCDHNCTNAVGSFECSCNDGYELSVDGLSCHGIATKLLQ